jgi:hypothetical protein
MCQRIARKPITRMRRRECFGSRYRAVRLIDEQAILACAAYVDLNPIQAGIDRM